MANAAGFGAFEEELSSGLLSSAVAVKGQIEGPITLSAYLFHNDRPFLADPTFFSAIAFHVSQIIGWQVDRLKSAGLPVLLFVDEPALCLDAPVTNAVPEEKRLNALAATLDGVRSRGALNTVKMKFLSQIDITVRTPRDIPPYNVDLDAEPPFPRLNASLTSSDTHGVRVNCVPINLG